MRKKHKVKKKKKMLYKYLFFLKKVSKSLVIKAMQIKTSDRVESYQIHNVGKGMLRQDLLNTAAGNKIHRKKSRST